MTTYFTGYNIQNLEVNPFLDIFFKNEYSQSPKEETITSYNTVNNVISTLGLFILETIISEFNFTHGTQYDFNNFGMVVIPNDQNARCSFLIFPLKTDIEIIIKVYMELGTYVEINFQKLGFVDSPDYFY